MVGIATIAMIMDYPLQKIHDFEQQTLVELLQEWSGAQELKVLLALPGPRDLHDGPEGFACDFPNACIGGS